jgi:hypothetical protein
MVELKLQFNTQMPQTDKICQIGKRTRIIAKCKHKSTNANQGHMG